MAILAAPGVTFCCCVEAWLAGVVVLPTALAGMMGAVGSEAEGKDMWELLLSVEGGDGV